MYIESDIRVPWQSLLGWAADAPLLAALGFQRAFYRVEPIEQSGRLGLTDQTEHVRLSEYPQTVHVNVTAKGKLVKVHCRWGTLLHEPYSEIATQTCAGYLGRCKTPRICLRGRVHSITQPCNQAVGTFMRPCAKSTSARVSQRRPEKHWAFEVILNACSGEGEAFCAAAEPLHGHVDR